MSVVQGVARDNHGAVELLFKAKEPIIEAEGLNGFEYVTVDKKHNYNADAAFCDYCS